MIFTRQRQINQEIPESINGLSDSVHVIRPGKLSSMKLRVNISHPRNGDLGLILESPSGQRINVIRPSDDQGNNLNSTFDSKGVLDKFIGESVEGEWKLNVVDHARESVGSVHTWALTFDVPAEESEVYLKQNKGEEALMSAQFCPQAGKIRSMKAVLELGEIQDEALTVFLTAPSGKDLKIFSRDVKTSGDIEDDFQKEFDAKSLKGFTGEEANGIWSLHVQGPKAKKSRLKKWSLDIQV